MAEEKTLDIRTMLSWALALILAWFFITSGYPKIIGGEAMANRFVDWGYSREFSRIIGILEILGGILVLIPRAAFYSSILFIGIMIGAIYTHLSTGIGSPAFAIILLILASAQAYITFNNALFIGKK